MTLDKLTLEKMTLDEETQLDALLACHAVEPPSRTLFENIIASAPQPQRSIWQQLSGWLSFRVAGIGLATAIAGALCVSIWTTRLLSDNADELANSAESVDFGQDWIG